MTVIKLQNSIFPGNLKIARQYRGLTQLGLCRKVPMLKQSDLAIFENGGYARIPEKLLIEIMETLDFPYEFLKKEVKDVKYIF